MSALEPAGENTVTLTLESGEVVTLAAVPSTGIFPNGVLFSDRYSDGPLFCIPSPHLRWLARIHLGLYGRDRDGEERWLDHYLMKLGSITEADWTGDVLTLAYLTPDGQRRFAQFTGDVTANFTWDPSDGGFTRYPLRVAIQQEEQGTEYVATFRADHTPEGYAALKALGWDECLGQAELK